MAAEAKNAPRHVNVVALEVSDQALYTEYRANMTPLLEACGGRFDYDFTIDRVLKARAGEPINRVFVISFPSRQVCEQFFADERYLEVRARYFEPSVGTRTRIAVFDET